ncbi:MAG TPA: anhydro-N-acetylmuramic acid kinase [Gemmatimonadaceae bacterium]|nr:anhydro-N-acetylmuramic acid kinase [Gemmatimonadaceae bacterium]
MSDRVSATRGDVLVGLMSGTSLDGITAVVARFVEHDDGHVTPELLAHVERPYTAGQRARLAAAMQGASPAEYTRLDFSLGGWLADAAVAAIAECGVSREEIRAVASHGHTVWHAGPQGTWQFGQAAVIAERTGLDVIADFRVRDVAAGGEGAPLVPIADALLFARPDAWRLLQNLGGIGNVTVLPPLAGPDAELTDVRAFDTGPGVCIIDGVVRMLYPELAFDRDGALAARGRAIDAVIEDLLRDPWYAAAPPKSTGRERYTTAFIGDFIARCRAARADLRDEDIVATAVWFTARSIALAVERFVPQEVGDVLLSGGGARNATLREAIAMALAPRLVRPFGELYFDGDAKEAVAFAFLGWLHLRRRAGNLRGATGARGPRVLGALYPG